MASIFVGDDTTEPYVVHLDLLTATSEFFKKALTGEFKEKDGIVRLADECPDVFERYMGWLYNAKLSTNLKWSNIFDIYAFGIFIQDDKFCNAVIDYLVKAVMDKKRIPKSLAHRAYLKLPPSSPFLMLLVDFWVHNTINDSVWFTVRNDTKSDCALGPAEFWVAVAHGLSVKASSKTGGGQPWEENKCRYHIHAEGAPKCS